MRFEQTKHACFSLKHNCVLNVQGYFVIITTLLTLHYTIVRQNLHNNFYYTCCTCITMLLLLLYYAYRMYRRDHCSGSISPTAVLT